MKKQLILAGLICIAALAGCATRTVPVANVTTPIAGQHTNDQIKTAILAAGQQRKWIMTPIYSGVIEGRLIQRSHVANIRINYSTTSYSINYVSSQNLLAGEGKIHRNYNSWINNLDRDIQLKLAEQQIK
ncbi:MULTISPECIES: hypothetical protein [unclassified Brenneria]|uniref:hypothetical protein n=1 Tax=unclassified Brenneria TaxID=2634434 RepID=UPI001554948B|nr:MULTISPECIES: hypothetical protein [unclassified Brenneria]MBJ7222273.1 hypothetical protein [Brenneria sp. L3-3C-1]MEE3643516.1 hypothetical protein [Brenneria sp. L3_3C_1]MEE3651700.1 hypothetical protein [Brenneria sp. HEZEL_4_2_4]NPD01656.1 hypothetical protein [Brenneria sp. hezel4-2-4]